MYRLGWLLILTRMTTFLQKHLEQPPSITGRSWSAEIRRFWVVIWFSFVVLLQFRFSPVWTKWIDSHSYQLKSFLGYFEISAHRSSWTYINQKSCMGIGVILDQGGWDHFRGPEGLAPEPALCGFSDVKSRLKCCVGPPLSNIIVSFLGFVTPGIASKYIELILWGNLRDTSNALVLPWN